MSGEQVLDHVHTPLFESLR
jgi:hypothetical protein